MMVVPQLFHRFRQRPGRGVPLAVHLQDGHGRGVVTEPLQVSGRVDPANQSGRHDNVGFRHPYLLRSRRGRGGRRPRHRQHQRRQKGGTDAAHPKLFHIHPSLSGLFSPSAGDGCAHPLSSSMETSFQVAPRSLRVYSWILVAMSMVGAISLPLSSTAILAAGT